MTIYRPLSTRTLKTVGAGLPAKNVNDNAGSLNKHMAFRFFASKLAPTYNKQ
ncbi:hypothetical protein [Pseudomonas sp. PAMC 26793]|uniref:hypothetical protein n=1 Tax=Pseudomonas sp. PAMC 26793 TaxID=1240676 RepID=UPI00030B9F66|nr:hypothetical protein [Pseudomonas sp. PAMC 26793]